MTTQTYILCAFAGLLGMLLYVFVVKIPSAMERSKAANIKFTMKDYFATEWPTLAGNIAAIAIALMIVGEAIAYKPEIQGWIVTIFAFYGFTGSSILLAVFGQFSKKLNSIIDIKTNVADTVTDTPITTIPK